jgi:EAL domain-containing protein (putative c-di-GMP-specific phosphodiesterase class I)
MTEPGSEQVLSDSSDSMHGYLDAGSLGRRIVASLPTLFARGVSLHDRSGHCHWRSSQENAASEHLGVRAALEAFVGNIMPSRVDVHLRDGNSAVLLISRTGVGEYTGFVLLLVPTERLRGKGRAAPDLPIPVMRAARHWGDLAAMHAAGIAGAATISSAEADPTSAALEQPAPTAAEPADRERIIGEIERFPIQLHAQRLQPLNSEVRIRRYEFLLRDSEDATSAVAPLVLLRDAESSGVATVLDRRVVKAAIEWLNQHLSIWCDDPSQFSINLSPSSLEDRDFLDFARQSLAEAGLPPGLIAIEVGHRAATQSRTRIEAVAEACGLLNVGLVIDDFTLDDNGADLLSLPALRLLKIDRRLTADLATSRHHQALVAGIAQMARLAGVHSVAKRVDSNDENRLLASLGVDFAQGFASAAPQSLDVLHQDLVSRVLVDNAALIDPSLPEYLKIKPASG